MVLLVDGYNVTMQAWPDVPIPEQRRRLVDALAGLAARTGVGDPGGLRRGRAGRAPGPGACHPDPR